VYCSAQHQVGQDLEGLISLGRPGLAGPGRPMPAERDRRSNPLQYGPFSNIYVNGL